jgi:hypothetical protein
MTIGDAQVRSGQHFTGWAIEKNAPLSQDQRARCDQSREPRIVK